MSAGGDEAAATNDAQPCAVCLNPPSNPYRLECDHEFCTSCIVQWFRSGHSSCPLCRDNTNADHLSYPTIMQRYVLMRRRARAKSASKRLKNLYKKLLKAEKDAKEHRKTLREFRRENSERIKHFTKLRRKRWTLERRVHQLKRRMGVFSDPADPLPLIRDIYGRMNYRSFERVL